MERWNVGRSAMAESALIDTFLEEVIAVCKKHGFSIGHEDGHGAFEVGTYSDGDAEWLRNAHDLT